MNAQEPCPKVEALSALMDGELGEPERIAVQSHVEHCPICTPVLAEFRRLHARFAALEATTPDFDLAPEVDRRIGAAIATGLRRPPPVARPARARWWQLAVLVPGGAAAVSVGLWLGAALPGAAPVARATAAQMAPFSTVPAGALCPVPQACMGSFR